MSGRRSFIRSLFDLSFRSLIGVRVVGVLYALALVIGAVVIFGTAFGAGFPDALNGVHGPVTITVKGTGMRALAVLLSPLAYLVYVIWIRFHFETLVVLFCIAENTASLADAGRAQSRRRGQGDRG